MVHRSSTRYVTRKKCCLEKDVRLGLSKMGEGYHRMDQVKINDAVRITEDRH